MRKIDLDQPPARATVLSYGPTKSGKTNFIATWPKLLVLAAGSEDGWEAIRSMDRGLWHDAKRKPEVWTIDDPVDLVTAIREAGAELQATPDKWRTIAVDTFSIIADDRLTYLERAAKEERGGKKQDGRLIYGELNSWMKAQITALHKLPVHVIWTCHVKAPSEYDPGGGPLLPGRAAAEGFPGRCSLVFYHAVELAGAEIQYVAYAQHHKAYAAGSRYGGIPARTVNPDYQQIAEAVGFVEGPITLPAPVALAKPKLNVSNVPNGQPAKVPAKPQPARR